MTAVDVDALDKLREAATAGPWTTDGDGVVMARFIAGDLPPLCEPIAEAHRPDAALIVAMHAALPDLLAEVRRGRALREAVEGLCSRAATESERRVPGEPYRSPAVEVARLRAVLAVDGGEQ